MNMIKKLSAAFIFAVVAGNVLAHTATDAPHQTYAEGDFKLESGEVIRDFSLSYVTHGVLNADKSNAILVVTAIGGNHHRLDYLIGAGKALDPDKYFIISTDAIGNGLTTSPSNSRLQPRMQFPRFTIRDMVQSQYPLVMQKFGIRATARGRRRLDGRHAGTAMGGELSGRDEGNCADRATGPHACLDNGSVRNATTEHHGRPKVARW